VTEGGDSSPALPQPHCAAIKNAIVMNGIAWTSCIIPRPPDFIDVFLMTGAEEQATCHVK
jgi:hypothetical protein